MGKKGKKKVGAVALERNAGCVESVNQQQALTKQKQEDNEAIEENTIESFSQNQQEQSQPLDTFKAEVALSSSSMPPVGGSPPPPQEGKDGEEALNEEHETTEQQMISEVNDVKQDTIDDTNNTAVDPITPVDHAKSNDDENDNTMEKQHKEQEDEKDNKDREDQEEDDEWEWEESVVNPHRQKSDEENMFKDQIDEIEALLKEFLLNLADSNVRDYVNSELSHTNYRQFMDYYLQHDRMGEYSIKAELNRMDFEVIFEGKRTLDKLEIMAIYEACPLHDLWKLANQSIYSEIITILQRIFGDPSLSIRIASTSSKFLINFDENYIIAESNFEFLTLQDITFRPLNKKPSDRLALASMKGTIRVDIKNRRSSQMVETPEIRIVFDDELRAAAKCILLFRQAEDTGDTLAVIDRQLEVTTEKAAQLFSKATQAGSRAFGNVVGAVGRLIRSNDNSSIPDESKGISNADSLQENPTVSFDDFMNDANADDKPQSVANSSSSNKSNANSGVGGGWFSSAAEGIVGSIGKLLQVDKAEGVGLEGSKGAGANQRPKNIFMRDDI